MNADELKVLATLTGPPTPTRKADLVDHILRYLEGDRLQTLWQSRGERGGGLMPDDLKNRLRAFVPAPIHSEVKTLEQLPAAYDRPFVRWDPVARLRRPRSGGVSGNSGISSLTDMLMRRLQRSR